MVRHRPAQGRHGVAVLRPDVRPGIGRFVSADSVVPGAADGSMVGIALKPLTVDVHETGFVATLAQENQQSFWFEMGDRQRHALSEFLKIDTFPSRYTYINRNVEAIFIPYTYVFSF